MAKLSYTSVFVRDMARSVAFYRDAVGLVLRFESPEWSEFATGSCTLALHRAAEGAMAPVGADNIPAGHCHVGLSVDDLDAFHAGLMSRGVRCLRPPRMEDFGAQMAVYADPDGLPVSVAGQM